MSDSEGLSAFEWGIVRRLVRGDSRKDIRLDLDITASALDASMQHIYRQTGAASDREVIRWANSQ